MENNNQEFQEKEEVKISKKSLYIGIAVVVALLLVGGYFAFFNKKEPSNTTAHIDSLDVKKDSALVKKDSLMDEYDEEGSPYGEHMVIANSVSLPDGQKLKFGDKVYVDYSKSTDANKIIYLSNPAESPSIKASPISINGDMLIDSYSFDDFKKYFSIPPYSTLPSGVKKILLSENGSYNENKRYYITQNVNRASSTVAMGDFDSDGARDIAVVLDNNETQESRFLIIGTNKATKNAYIAFTSNFSDRLKIKAFQKGASVYMDSDDFVSAPRDGVVLSNEWGAVIVIYDVNAQKFKIYDQVPKQEIKTSVGE